MLPRLIMVREDKDGDDTYLLAFKNLDDAVGSTEGKMVTVGLYKLVSIRKAKLAPLVVGDIKLVH